MSNGNLKSAQQSDNMEQDDIVKVEETTINLDCIKKELDEGEFDNNRYKLTLTFQNLFGQCSKELRDNKDSLIGFLDDEVIMETGCIKLKDVKEEEDLIREIMEQSSKQQSDNIEQDDIVKVEETTINLDCIKKELDEGEFEFDDNWYKLTLTFQNLFGESSKELRDNKDSLIGFLDDEVIMETGCIKLKDLKEEEDLIREIMEQSDCNKCGGSYEGYCPSCSSLSHILNNLTPNINSDPILNTAPVNMLEIKEVSTRQAVFALKTLPKGIILGPFEGIAPIESTNGLKWKTKDRKFVNDQNGNWMKYIGSVANDTSKNLDVYQFGGVLYFETSREIQEGEELLVCYREEKDKVLKWNSEKEFYLIPVMKEKYPKVFACTLCCLGFRLERCLVEHKSKCPQGDHGGSIEDFEIIQCRCCKVWLEKQEHLERHLLHCLDNYNRLHDNLRDIQPTNTDENAKVRESEETSTPIDAHETYSPATEKIECNNCLSGIHCKAHKKKDFHDEHTGTKHSNTGEKKYKCSQCPYQANTKSRLKYHNSVHSDIKKFQCFICNNRYTLKSSLQKHIRIKHSNASEKKYKCSECSFQTNYKHPLERHFNHMHILQCGICKKRFDEKADLKLHIKTLHSNTSEEKYKCARCSYQTDYKSSYKQHLHVHNDIKHFQCDICKKRFNQKRHLNLHIKSIHSNTIERKYKCSQCPYETIRKQHLNRHLHTHSGIKAFECYICNKKFGQKYYLKQHVVSIHFNTGEKAHKCSKCSYQTNNTSHIKRHIRTHGDLN